MQELWSGSEGLIIVCDKEVQKSRSLEVKIPEVISTGTLRYM